LRCRGKEKKKCLRDAKKKAPFGERERRLPAPETEAP